MGQMSRICPIRHGSKHSKLPPLGRAGVGVGFCFHCPIICHRCLIIRQHAKRAIAGKRLTVSQLRPLARFWHLYWRMKTTISIILLSLTAPVAATAQQAWTLDRCVNYALEHSTEVRRQHIEQRQKRVDYRTALLDFLPGVSAQVGGQYNWGRNIDPETNTYNNVTTFNNYYQLTASMPLFDGGQTWNAMRKARLAKRTSATALQKAQDDKAIDIMQKFVEAVYAIKSIDIMQAKLNDSQALLGKTRRLYELGEKSRPDVVQMESQVAEDDYNLLHQRNTARLSLLSLKSAMNYPAADSLPLDTTLKAKPTAVPRHEAIDYTAIAAKPDVTIAEADAETARLDWKMQRASLLPSLYLGGGVSTSYYKNLSAGAQMEGFRSQMRNNLGEYVYVTLSIPLFSPSSWRSVKRAKTDYHLARLDVEDARRKLEDDARQAVADYEGYVREQRQMERKAASDSLAYRLSYRKYEEGMLSTFDLHEASQTYLQSRITLLQMQMMAAIKQRLVNYYINNEPLWTSN